MNNFQATWDAHLKEQVETPIDLIASISEDFINSFLTTHRKKDKNKYYHKIELPLYLDDNGNMTFFKSFINIGGKVKEDGRPDNTDAKPFVIDFANKNQLGNPFVKYEYVEGIDFNNENIPPPTFPNLSLKCENIGILLEWPKQNGSGENHTAMLNLFIDFNCKVDFIKEGNRTSLKFIPTLVQVGSSTYNPNGDIVQDLIIVLVNYIMKEQGPKFVREFEIPVVEMNKYEFLPNLIKIDNDLLSVYMNRDVDSIHSLVEEVESSQDTFLKLVDKDLSEEKNLVKLMYGEEVNKAMLNSNDDNEKIALIEKSKMKSFKEIFPVANTFLEVYEKKVDFKNFIADKKENQNIGVAVVEDFLDTILRDSIPGSKEKSTKTKSALDVIKGRIRTWVRLFNSDIEINTDGRLKGTTQVDIGAMLEYKLKEYYRCSTGWSSWKKIGLRVKGKPALSVKVKNSRKGVGINVDVDIKNLSLSTGLGRLIDALVNALFKLFLWVIDGILKILSTILSFIIFPVEFELSQQKTKIKLSNFHQWRYNRSDLILRDNEKRYLSFLVKGTAI